MIAPGKKTEDNKAWWQPALMVFFRLSGWIAPPVIISVFLGKWLDKKFATEPWLFLATVGLSFLVSMFGLTKEAMKEFKKIDNNNKDSITASSKK